MLFRSANVLKRCLEQPILVTPEELLSISPDLCTSTRELCSSRRFVPEPVLAQDGLEAPVGDSALPFADESDPDTSRLDHKQQVLLASMPVTFDRAQDPPPDAVVVPDFVEMYINTLPPGEELAPLQVALETASIRAITGVFQNRTEVSCIHDSGCSIIAMSEVLCNHLGLAYDPRVILKMQSANGACDFSLGLARNVPVRFDRITVYLQFHIIRSPAYDVLLGKPFDLLTRSVVSSRASDAQTITLHDPNSDMVTTIATVPRRAPEFLSSGPGTRAVSAGDFQG